jgi:uncharacterized FAD-dependent dehydrogenase
LQAASFQLIEIKKEKENLGKSKKKQQRKERISFLGRSSKKGGGSQVSFTLEPAGLAYRSRWSVGRDVEEVADTEQRLLRRSDGRSHVLVRFGQGLDPEPLLFY